MALIDTALEPFPYQLQLVQYLKSEEGDLWTWFASSPQFDAYAASVRLELLKVNYRFDASDHPRLYELANIARTALEIDAPLTIYQSTDATQANACLAYVPGELHVILQGNVLSLLTEDELQAALAHELTHYVLWERFDRDLYIAHQLLEAIASHPNAADSHVESARLFALYNEIHADRGTLAVMSDPLPGIRSIIKLQTGLAEVHAESYLRQADEIFSRESARTKQLTHPESFIRARALKMWSEIGRESFAQVERMIAGEADLASLDLVGQIRTAKLTRQLIATFLAPVWFRTDAVLGHARKFFPDVEQERGDADLYQRIRSLSSATQQYLSYVLLDFVVADPDLEDAPAAAAIDFADRCGMRGQMLEILTKEIEMPKKRLAKIETDRAQILEAAKRQADAEGRR